MGQPTPIFISYLLQSKVMAGLLGLNFLIGVLNQLTIFSKYSLGFYLLGWAITLYPVVLAILYFLTHWTKKEDLKLSFFELDLRRSAR